MLNEYKESRRQSNSCTLILILDLLSYIQLFSHYLASKLSFSRFQNVFLPCSGIQTGLSSQMHKFW